MLENITGLLQEQRPAYTSTPKTHAASPWPPRSPETRIRLPHRDSSSWVPTTCFGPTVHTPVIDQADLASTSEPDESAFPSEAVSERGSEDEREDDSADSDPLGASRAPLRGLLDHEAAARRESDSYRGTKRPRVDDFRPHSISNEVEEEEELDPIALGIVSEDEGRRLFSL